MGNYIFVISARDNNLYTDAYKTTMKQLNKNNICCDKLICTFDKAKICVNEQIDLFIDDSIENCKKVSDMGIKTLLFNSKGNKNLNTDLNRVNSWKEIYEYILESR